MSPRERDLEDPDSWKVTDGDDLDEDDLEIAPPPPPRKRIALNRLFEDEHFEAINKPAGLSTVSERWRPDAPTVISELWKDWQKSDPDVVKPHVVHRLDRGTTGVILFARHRDAQVSLREQFRERTVQKTYYALVQGIPRDRTGTIHVEIIEDDKHLGKMRTARKGGKVCETEYEVVDTFRDLSWVRCRPHQGRTHQIRISLQSIGHPCVVDDLYGSKEPLLMSTYKRKYRTGRGREERPLLDRLGLHATTLELNHPHTGERMTIESPFPKDLAATLKQLDRHARD